MKEGIPNMKTPGGVVCGEVDNENKWKRLPGTAASHPRVHGIGRLEARGRALSRKDVVQLRIGGAGRVVWRDPRARREARS